MKPEQYDFGARYGGRLVQIEVYCNTDEDPDKIAKRVQRAARGIKLNAAVVRVGLYEGEKAKEMWDLIAQWAAQTHADPNAKPIDFSKDD